MIFTTGAACTGGSHCNIEIDGNSTVFTAGGVVTLNHLGGDNNSNDYIHLGSGSGSPSFTSSGLVLNGQAGNATRFRTSNAVVATINGDLTLSASAAGKTMVDLNGTTVFQLKGSFLRSPSPNRFGSLTTATNTTVKYIGSAGAQVIAGDAGSGGDGFSYHNVEINNTYATIPQLSMNAEEGNATIPNGSNLTFTNGVVSSLSNAIFVISDGATCTQGNAGSYVDGPIKKIGNSPTSFVFPVGSINVWARLGISQFSSFSGSTEFTCQYHILPAPNNSPGNMGSTIGPQLDHVSYIEYWELERSYDQGNDANCHVTLYWEDTVRSKISNLPDLRVSHFESAGTTKWENHGQGSVSSSGTTGNITSVVKVANFSPITFGSWQGLNPLPVELISFHATVRSDKTVFLNWEVLSQINNDYFTVERSKDGIVFEELTKIDGAGNSSQPIIYETKDMHPFAGTTFYRLKQTDFNGAYSYSKIEQVNISEDAFNLLVYPNPSNGIFNVISYSASSHLRLRIADTRGNLVYEKVFSEQSFILDLRDFATGVYYLQAVAENSLKNFKLVIQ